MKQLRQPKECPFCGSKSVIRQDASRYWVECTECQMGGPKAYNIIKAVDAWDSIPMLGENKRLKTLLGKAWPYVQDLLVLPHQEGIRARLDNAIADELMLTDNAKRQGYTFQPQVSEGNPNGIL